MANALVICCEGPCEQSFFSALLKRHGYTAPKKLRQIYYKEGKLIFLPPCSGVSCQHTGKSALLQKEKYVSLADEIESVARNQGINPDTKTLAVCFDTEEPQADYRTKERAIREQATKHFSHAGAVTIHPVSGSIENWFIAGLVETLANVKKHDDYERLIRDRNPDDINGAKRQFYECFENPFEETLISLAVGEKFDIEEACRLSPTFNAFYTEKLQFFL